MQVQVLRLSEAAAVVGVTRDALRARLKRSGLLTDAADPLAKGQDPEVLVVDGVVVKDLAHAADLVRGLARQGATLSAGIAESDLVSLQARVRDLEQELQLARHDLELERARAAADSLTMVDALQTVARHIRTS